MDGRAISLNKVEELEKGAPYSRLIASYSP